MYPVSQNNPMGYYGYDTSNFDASAYGASGYDANAYNANNSQQTQQTQQMPMGNFTTDQNFATQKPNGFATEPAAPTGQTHYHNGNFDYGTPAVKRSRPSEDQLDTVTPPAKRTNVDGTGLDDTNSSGYQSGFGSPPTADQTQGSPVNNDQYQNQGGNNINNNFNVGGANNVDFTQPWAGYDQPIPAAANDPSNSNMANGNFNQMPPWAANNDHNSHYYNIGSNATSKDPEDEPAEDQDPDADTVVPVPRPIDNADALVYDIATQLDNETLFTKVSGRLNILSYNKKLPITVAEIRRRIAQPECLNHSVMAAYLRKAKNKEGGQWLTRELQRYQISLQSGRRKSVSNTAFTALCEVEAIMLTDDQQKMTNAKFPIKHSVMEMFYNIFTVEEYFAKFHTYLYAAQQVAETIKLLKLDNSPLTSAPLNPPLRCHPDTQAKITKFVNLTHGYGHIATTNNMMFLQKYLSMLLDVFEDPSMFVSMCKRANEMPIAPVLDLVLSIPPEAYMAWLQQAKVPEYLNHPMQQYSGYGMPGMMQNGYMNNMANAMQMQQAMFGGYSNPMYTPNTNQMPTANAMPPVNPMPTATPTPQDMNAGNQTPQAMPQGMNNGYSNAQMMQNMSYMNYMQQQQNTPQVQQPYF